MLPSGADDDSRWNEDTANYRDEEFDWDQCDQNGPLCSLLMLARIRPAAPAAVDGALRMALRSEPCREHLRAIAGTLAGLDPLTV